MFEDIEYAALTDVGRERSENQDNYGDARFERYEFFYVCDGMGGHAGGSTAARLAVDTIYDVLNHHSDHAPDRLEKSIQAANEAIFEKQVHQRELRGMGTTVVAIALDKEKHEVHFAHVGDSRGYLLRQQVFRRLTRDHTMVQRLVDDGVISEEEAEHHPNSNVISRSLGGYPEVEVEHGEAPLEFQTGDTFLLCSDGLSGLVSESEMASILAKHDPSDAVELLVRRANEEGGHDNITVEVIRLGTFGSTNPSEPIRIEHPPRGPSSRELLEREREAAERLLAESGMPGKTGDTVALDFHRDSLASDGSDGSDASDADDADDLESRQPMAESPDRQRNGATTAAAPKARRPEDRKSASRAAIAEQVRYFQTRQRLFIAIAVLLIVFLALLIMLLLDISARADGARVAAALLVSPASVRQLLRRSGSP